MAGWRLSRPRRSPLGHCRRLTSRLGAGRHRSGISPGGSCTADCYRGEDLLAAHDGVSEWDRDVWNLRRLPSIRRGPTLGPVVEPVERDSGRILLPGVVAVADDGRLGGSSAGRLGRA